MKVLLRSKAARTLAIGVLGFLAFLIGGLFVW